MCIFKNHYIEECDNILNDKSNLIQKILNEKGQILKGNLDGIKDIINIPANELLIELIINNYITENYIDYITSPIIDENLSKKDSDFFFYVIHGVPNYTMKIDNYDTVLEFLKEYYGKRSILNCNLISYLLMKSKTTSGNNKYKQILYEISKQFETIRVKQLSFFKTLKRENINTFKKFLIYLEQQNIIIWNIINKNITTEKVKEITIWCALFQSIDKIKDKSSLKKAIQDLSKAMFVKQSNCYKWIKKTI